MSGMDLSGETLLQDFFLSQRPVRLVICADFVRVGESIRVGVARGSRNKIRLQVPEFEWPDRDAYHYREHSLKRSPAGTLEPTEGRRHESSGAAHTA